MWTKLWHSHIQTSYCTTQHFLCVNCTVKASELRTQNTDAKNNTAVYGKWFEPRGISYLFGMIIQVKVVFRKTVVGD